MIWRLATLCLLWLASLAAAAEPVELRGPLMQGGLIIGQAPAGSQVRLDGQALRVSPQGNFVFGLGRDHPAQIDLRVVLPDGAQWQRRLNIASRSYQIQRIDGLPPSKVSPDAEALKRIRAEGAQVAGARKTDAARVDFLQDFVWPSVGPISGVYGSQRILNGQPRRPHYGVDVAAPTGTPVVAPAAGVVTLAHPDMYYSGGTLIVDHGHGVSSSFLHLSRIDVEVGQRVEQGQKIAEIGATGRVTGAHLDWRMNWFKQRIDPALLVPDMPQANPPAGEM
ncbi:peptidase M23 [Oceanococcus atlanticus]|uniref:Peptidase M23 n=1 Tax=Oceanococcus atlanticus TaxID=1317117 RepID=A0A1Y1SG06_9GAMM|nr:M23 family metallopeptidase [Oceanococcus atlanticus]ORE88583.1 peptidase M23 [Oceanococcus atlanticus]